MGDVLYPSARGGLICLRIIVSLLYGLGVPDEGRL